MLRQVLQTHDPTVQKLLMMSRELEIRQQGMILTIVSSAGEASTVEMESGSTFVVWVGTVNHIVIVESITHETATSLLSSFHGWLDIIGFPIDDRRIECRQNSRIKGRIVVAKLRRNIVLSSTTASRGGFDSW